MDKRGTCVACLKKKSVWIFSKSGKLGVDEYCKECFDDLKWVGVGIAGLEKKSTKTKDVQTQNGRDVGAHTGRLGLRLPVER